MRIFITGGSGWIGSGVIRELVAAGHSVTALVRTDAAAAKVKAAGAEPRMGDITDLPTLSTAIESVDGVIHLAFDHRFTTSDLLGAIAVRLTHLPSLARISRAARTDLRAIETMIAGLAGKSLVVTSPIAGLRQRVVGTEDDRLITSSFGAIRIASERIAIAAKHVRTASIRLPPTVHGAGDTGFVKTLVDLARSTGRSVYRGSNHWPAVHRDDAAELYRFAIEGLAGGSIPAGTVLHGVAEQGVAFEDIARAIGKRTGVPVEFGKVPGFVGMVTALDLQATAYRTRAKTGWIPSRPGLLDDIASVYG
ncbi:MAG: NAD(P)H-binding protein [Kofleriaceae bacterium]